MDFFTHELTHFFLSLCVAFIVWKKYKKPLPAIFAALIGGILIDLDHLFDYFLAFGPHINLSYISNGFTFLKSGKIYLLLHAWEWVVLFLITVSLSKSKVVKSVLLSFALALFLHLLVDIKVNHVTVSGYSIIYRLENNFDLKKLVTAEHYKTHLQQKKSLQRLF